MMWLVSTTLAAGFYSSEGGVKATGRAGAYTAGVDDLSAQTWNVAALTRVNPSVGLQLAGVHQQVVFDRLDETDLLFESVRNAAPPMPIPAVGIVFAPRERLRVAVGAYSPYAPRFAFPGDGPQRFTLVDSLILSANVGPSVAWRFEHLSVGAGLAWTFVSVQQSLVSHVAPLQFQAEDDPAYDVTTTLDLVDPFELTWNAGLLYDRDRLAIGASYTPQVRFEPTGSLHTDFSRNTYYVGDGPLGKIISAETSVDEDVAMDVVLPRIARIGVLVRPSDRLELEADVVWQQWSSMPALEVREVDLVIETEQAEDVVMNGNVALPGEMQDSFALRLGGEVAANERIDLRAGVQIERSAVASEYRSVFFPDGNELGYGLGGSIALGRGVGVDLGWAQSFLPKHDIDTSWVYQVQIDPNTGEVGTGKRVGAGSLRSTTSTLGLGLSWSPERDS